jgi:leader peptidase (prepilin peptidase)/N-methyltransferase
MIEIICIAGVLGILIGSFLNVVIYRLPRMMEQALAEECRLFSKEPSLPPTTPFNIAWPASHCPHCKHRIHPFDNIPILSFLLLGRRCRHCQAAISLRYPSVELFTGLATAFITAHFGLSAELPFALIFLWACIALFWIDLEIQLLPDTITLPLLWLGLIANLNGLFVDLQSAVIGAIAGYLVLWSITHLYALLTKKIGMGQGDFKLLALLGAWFGWQQLPFLILVSSVLGLMCGFLILRYKKQTLQTPFAFGPYLIIAGGIVLLWKNALLSLV